MSHYTKQQEANNEIDATIKKATKDKGELSISNLVLEVTNKYPVSIKSVMKRIELHLTADQRLTKEGDLIKRK